MAESVNKYKAGDILRAKYPGNRVARLIPRDGVLWAVFNDELPPCSLQDWIDRVPYGVEQAEDTFKAYDKLRGVLDDDELANRVAEWDWRHLSGRIDAINAYRKAVIKKLNEDTP